MKFEKVLRPGIAVYVTKHRTMLERKPSRCVPKTRDMRYMSGSAAELPRNVDGLLRRVFSFHSSCKLTERQYW